MIRRHITLMLLLIAAAMAAGVALAPSERERWTMFARDGRNEEARALLQARYDAGGRDPAAVLQLYKLLMSDAEISRATRLIEQLAASRPDDVETLTLLARHYGDTQDAQGQTRTLERLFELEPSPQAAEVLLARYRLDGASAQEENLLRALLDRQMIATSDAERLGLLAYARDDLDEAIRALAHFDTHAAPEQVRGRFALFDLLVRVGDTPKAFAKAADWIVSLRKAKPQEAVDPDGPVVELAEAMNAADPGAARRTLCGLMETDAGLAAYEQTQDVDCSQPAQDNVAETPAAAPRPSPNRDSSPRRWRSISLATSERGGCEPSPSGN